MDAKAKGLGNKLEGIGKEIENIERKIERIAKDVEAQRSKNGQLYLMDPEVLGKELAERVSLGWEYITNLHIEAFYEMVRRAKEKGDVIDLYRVLLSFDKRRKDDVLARIEKNVEDGVLARIEKKYESVEEKVKRLKDKVDEFEDYIRDHS